MIVKQDEIGMILDHPIVKHGAEARARGESVFDNPYAEPENMPSAADEGTVEWLEKHDAWVVGWRLEDLTRDGQRVPR
jgi:hypothetical protein